MFLDTTGTVLNYQGRRSLRQGTTQPIGEDYFVFETLRARLLTGVAALLVVANCLTLSLPVQAQPVVETPTNYDLLRQATDATADDLVKSLQRTPNLAPVALRAVNEHEGNFLVESSLSSALTRAGLDVRTRADSIGAVLEFEIVDLGVAYTDVRRHAWLGAKRIEREARARLFARLLDDTQTRIVWAEQAHAKVIDEVPHGELENLEEKSGPEYLNATLPAQRWNKLVEPVVVTAIVAGLIVLFFSNQDATQ